MGAHSDWDKRTAGSNVKALILEDDQRLAKLLSLCAETVDSLEATLCNTADEFWEVIEKDDYDVFLLDYLLPDASGIDILRKLRENEDYKHCPVVMVTAEDDRAVRVAALKGGATDFLIKPFDTNELTSRIRNMVALREYHLMLEQENETLEKLATTDALTEVWNRRSFMDRLQREIHRAFRFDQTLTVAMLDADHFKSVNDTYGHGVGDEVLKGIAAATKKRLRDIDIVGRLGGEEFALCLAQTPAEGGHIVADRIRTDISELIFQGGDKEFGVTVSIGLAEWRRGETATEALERADQALYDSKNNGRNQVTLHTEEK